VHATRIVATLSLLLLGWFYDIGVALTLLK
jgi:hypothetical protein